MTVRRQSNSLKPWMTFFKHNFETTYGVNVETYQTKPFRILDATFWPSVSARIGIGWLEDFNVFANGSVLSEIEPGDD